MSANVETTDGIPVPSYKANIRETDNQVLNVVTDRYKVVQNEDAFAFTDSLLGEGVTLVLMSSHDGTGAIKAAMTPIRVVCQNTLNLALSTARNFPLMDKATEQQKKNLSCLKDEVKTRYYDAPHLGKLDDGRQLKN